MKKNKKIQRISFFKPVKLNTRKSIKKIPLRNLTWPQASIRFPKLNPFGDSDRDDILNMFDCRPFDASRHGRSWVSKESKMESYTKLRKAGYPPEIANKISAWFKPKVQQFIDGKRDYKNIHMTSDQRDKLNAVRGNTEKVKEFFAKYRKEIPEYQKEKELGHKQYLENRENILKRVKEYSKRNDAVIKEKQKKYRETHKEKLAELNKDYYEENKEEMLDNVREYRKANIEKIHEYDRIRGKSPERIKSNKENYHRNKEVLKIINNASEYNIKDVGPSAQELIDDSEDLNNPEDKK